MPIWIFWANGDCNWKYMGIMRNKQSEEEYETIRFCRILTVHILYYQVEIFELKKQHIDKESLSLRFFKRKTYSSM